MASSLNLSLTDELRRYVNERSGDGDVYATPSEFIRDLIRQDMKNRQVVDHVRRGLDDIRNGRLSKKSILDIADED